MENDLNELQKTPLTEYDDKQSHWIAWKSTLYKFIRNIVQAKIMFVYEMLLFCSLTADVIYISSEEIIEIIRENYSWNQCIIRCIAKYFEQMLINWNANAYFYKLMNGHVHTFSLKILYFARK